MKYLIAGLGNIGEEYKHTRHNIGFDVADAFVAKHGGSFRSDRLADVAECKWKGKVFVVIKPTTYMNLSGKAVKYWLDKEKVPVEHLAGDHGRAGPAPECTAVKAGRQRCRA